MLSNSVQQSVTHRNNGNVAKNVFLANIIPLKYFNNAIKI